MHFDVHVFLEICHHRLTAFDAMHHRSHHRYTAIDITLHRRHDRLTAFDASLHCIHHRYTSNANLLRNSLQEAVTVGDAR